MPNCTILNGFFHCFFVTVFSLVVLVLDRDVHRLALHLVFDDDRVLATPVAQPFQLHLHFVDGVEDETQKNGDILVGHVQIDVRFELDVFAVQDCKAREKLYSGTGLVLSVQELDDGRVVAGVSGEALVRELTLCVRRRRGKLDLKFTMSSCQEAQLVCL